MAGPRIISIIGRKNAGKTTLTVALAAEFVRRGKRVMTIKHGHHAARRRPRRAPTAGGTSTRARPSASLLAGPEGRVLFERVPDLYDPVALARQLPHRRRHHPGRGLQARAAAEDRGVAPRGRCPTPLYNESAPDRDQWVALVTDDETYPRRLPRDPLPRHDVAPPARHARVGRGPGARRVTTPLGAREAALRILEDVRPQPALRVPLDDALGSVLAEDIVSPLDIPAWTNSAMDGYATRADDVRGASAAAPVRLRVVEQIPAGHFPTRARRPGRVRPHLHRRRRFPRAPTAWCGRRTPTRGRTSSPSASDRDAGANLRHAGEDVRRGAIVLRQGARARCRGTRASSPRSRWRIRWFTAGPRVAILGSGDEIVDVDQPEEILSGRKIASSNTHTLIALVRLAGGEPVNLGVARDTRESFREHLAAGAGVRTCWSPPPASAWASTTTCARSWRRWAPRRSSGGFGCGPARRWDSACSARSRGSGCPATR